MTASVEAHDGLQVLVGGGVALSSLLVDWEGLQATHPTSSPFQSAAWASAYSRSYGTDDAVTVALRRDGVLSGAAMFRSSRRGPATVLTSAPVGVSDFNDVVLGTAEQAAPDLVEGLVNAPDWDVVDFREVPPSADLWRILPLWPGRALRLPAAQCVVMNGRSLEDFASDLPRAKRKQLGQRQRKIARSGVTGVMVEGGYEAAVGRLLALHQASWVGKTMNPEHATKRFHDLLVGTMQRLGPRREAFIIEFHQGGRVLGSALYLVGPRYVGVYLTGYHPDLREQVPLHVLDTAAGFDLVADLGLSQLHLLRGAEDYKLRMSGVIERNERVVLLRPGSAPGRAVASGILARRKAAAVVRGGRQRLSAWAGREAGGAA